MDFCIYFFDVFIFICRNLKVYLVKKSKSLKEGNYMNEIEKLVVVLLECNFGKNIGICYLDNEVV